MDRNIKIWENDPKSKQVVQTLVGHNGTVLALKYAKQSDTIFSASNDKTLKIWKQEEGREFLFHPCIIYFKHKRVCCFLSRLRLLNEEND